MKKEFNVDEYRKMMTLYIQLRKGYQGDWFFFSKNNDFQLMVKKDPSGVYYLIVNGTQFNKISNDLVALEVFSKKKFPFEIKTKLDPRISFGSTIEFETLIKPLQSYLQTLPSGSDLIIGGHSQGGGITSILLLWIQTTFPGKFNIKAYSSAPVSIGNTDFKTLVEEAAEYGIYRIVNPKDIVPHLYADIPLIIQKNIPIKVPLRIKIKFYFVYYLLKLLGRDYQHIGEPILLNESTIDMSNASTLEKVLHYEYVQLKQHHPEQYLNLLDEQKDKE
ncbi:MAG: hypothetical protein S4CHLAM20_05010 [Chlamydiia bacterium]|nr:hypothetical protein [Chlamydiia bacterium]